jgi:hypothetical protein
MIAPGLLATMSKKKLMLLLAASGMPEARLQSPAAPG